METKKDLLRRRQTRRLHHHVLCNTRPNQSHAILFWSPIDRLAAAFKGPKQILRQAVLRQLQQHAQRKKSLRVPKVSTTQPTENHHIRRELTALPRLSSRKPTLKRLNQSASRTPVTYFPATNQRYLLLNQPA